MKRHLMILSLALIAIWSSATGFSNFKGVWASDDAEALVSDSVCIFFQRVDGVMEARLDIPVENLHHRTRFVTPDSVVIDREYAPLQLSMTDGKLNVDGVMLIKVEDFETCGPYDMTQAKSQFDIGRCLQEWRLGVNYGADGDFVYCEGNTNRHMFVYMINPSMVYIRAATTRNNDRGTLFFQNIRMMRNNNTGEATSYMETDNLSVAKNDLEMDNSKFSPDKCTFCPDGGIYWSLISFTPDRILINGCGETYRVERSGKSTDKCEWIKFRKY